MLSARTIAIIGGFLSTFVYAAPQAPTITDPAAATAATVVPVPATPVPALDEATNAGTLGSALVRNQCSFPVYVYVRGPDVCDPQHTLAAHGGIYSEGYKGLNVGRSIKIGRTSGEVAKPILQFEYTNGAYQQVYYDLSEINGHPFDAFGVTLTTSNPNCFHMDCHPNQEMCGFYQHPNDPDTHACPRGADIGVTLCSG